MDTNDYSLRAIDEESLRMIDDQGELIAGRTLSATNSIRSNNPYKSDNYESISSQARKMSSGPVRQHASAGSMRLQNIEDESKKQRSIIQINIDPSYLLQKQHEANAAIGVKVPINYKKTAGLSDRDAGRLTTSTTMMSSSASFNSSGGNKNMPVRTNNLASSSRSMSDNSHRAVKSQQPDDDDDEEEEDEDVIRLKKRDQWSNKMEYMLSVIGYVVDLGNCVRFPYVTYKNGGGAFLVPYFVFLVLIGVPMMYMEMAIGQYYRVGNISLWGKVNVFMKGIGYGSMLVVCYISLYYATIIAYSVFYLFASFRSVMPWSTCNNVWNTANCYERVESLRDSSRNLNVLYHHNRMRGSSGLGLVASAASNAALNVSSSLLNATNVTPLAELAKDATAMSSSNQSSVSPAEEYYYLYMLGINKSTGLHDLGPIKLDLSLCLALVYILMYVCICKGVKSTGKAVYVTATLPYIILLVLLFHGLTLEGSKAGIYYFLTPTFNKLSDYSCWKDAAIQIFFTLGPGISVLTTYASYSKFNNNCQIDAISASVANVIASFLAGVVVFASLGHLSHEVGKPIEDVTADDLGLSFIAYPEILSTFKYSAFFSIIFFLMIINLGLDSSFGGLEAIYTALADEFAIIKKHRKSFMAVIHLMLFLGSLPTVTYGGAYMVAFLDTFSTSPALMAVVFFETVSVCWMYGSSKFSDNIHEMFGVKPNRYWIICWKYVSPLITLTLFVMSIVFFKEPEVNNYKYPKIFIIFGWALNCSIMLPIPIYALYMYVKRRYGGKDDARNNQINSEGHNNK